VSILFKKAKTLFKINSIKLKRNSLALTRASFVSLDAISIIEVQIEFDFSATFNIVFATIKWNFANLYSIRNN